MKTINDVRKLESERYAAMIAGDAKRLGELLSDGLVYTHSSGSTDDKASYLAGVTSGKFTYHAIKRPIERIQMYGDTAVISGEVHIEVTVGGTRRNLTSRHLNVWVKNKDGWKMVAWESTPIAAQAATPAPAPAPAAETAKPKKSGGK